MLMEALQQMGDLQWKSQTLQRQSCSARIAYWQASFYRRMANDVPDSLAKLNCLTFTLYLVTPYLAQ